MNHFLKITAVVAVLTSLNAVAADKVFVTEDLRTDAKYYVRWGQITPENMTEVGLPSAPGTGDDEGYCQVNAPFMIRSINLQAGDVLEVISERSWTRKEYDYLSQSVIDIKDSVTALKRKSDGVEFNVGCSIDGGASERTPYKGIADNTTKAYMTILGLFVK